MNVFQRIDDASNLWREATGKGYDDWLTEGELRDLKILFQKRHLLAHTEGIVDQRYLAQTGDTSYHLDQRIVVKEPDVLSLTNLIEKVAAGMKATVSGHGT
jgi:hypothetical protein